MSIIATRVQNARANGNLDKNELRLSRYGGLDTFMIQSQDPAGILTEELKAKALASIGSTLETPVIQYDGNVTIGSTRSAVIADDENTSAMYSISFTTYAFGFTQVPVAFDNNEIDMQKDFNTKLKKNIVALGAVLDSAAITALGADKTQVFADPLGYTITGNVVQVPNAERENILGDLNVMMEANDHFDTIDLVANGGVQSLINKLKQSAEFNAENKTLEFIDKNLHYSTRIPNAGTEAANGFAVQAGSLGILTRFEREAMKNTRSRTGHEWGIETLPMLGFPVGTYYYESVGDYSAIAGAATTDMKRVVKEHYGFAVDVAFITLYNSDPATIASPIMKFAITKA